MLSFHIGAPQTVLLFYTMQLVGIGFSRSYWISLVKRLQNQVSHQLNTELVGESNSVLKSVIISKISEEYSERILNLKPDWVLFSASAFETPELCLNLLQKVEINSSKKLHYVLVVDEINPGLTIILKLQPVFELVNKMKFKISDPDLLLTHHINKFPRIRLGKDCQTIDYKELSGKLVRQSPSEVPLNTLIPMKNILKIKTNNTGTKPEKWLNNILLQHGRAAHPDQVMGILRETKGCYLFPGIPFNSILNIKLEDTKIEHIIRLEEYKIKNPPFTRLIENMQKEHDSWLRENRKRAKQPCVHIHCLGGNHIINTLMQKLFKDIGYKNFKLISKKETEELQQVDSVIFIKLNKFPAKIIRQKHIDWNKDFNQIIEPLNNFIALSDLKMGDFSDSSPIQKEEFEKLRVNILEEIKGLETKKLQAESDQMIYNQAWKILKKITPFSKKLLEALSSSRDWESVDEFSEKIKQPRVILFCENENVAAELNFKLTEIPRKLWINPFRFHQAEDLTQLNSKMTHSYLKPGTIIITRSARTHLEKLCRQALHEVKNAEITMLNCNTNLLKIKANLEFLQHKKNQSAFRWLHVSLKNLLYRDRHFFQNSHDKLK